jgi:hypothetical protein
MRRMSSHFSTRPKIKPTFALLIAVAVSLCTARGSDVKVNITLATDVDGTPVMSFSSDTATLYAMFKTQGVKAGDKVRGALIAEDVGNVAPANTKVADKTLTLDEDTDDGDFYFSKPDNGWPVGKYRIDIYVNEQLAGSVKFTITVAG